MILAKINRRLSTHTSLRIAGGLVLNDVVATFADIEYSKSLLFVTVEVDETNHDQKTIYIKEGSDFIRFHTYEAPEPEPEPES